MGIGEQIRASRNRAGLTQIDVAEKAGIAVNSLRNYESGKRDPNFSQLHAISKAIGISVLELISAPDWSDSSKTAAEFSDSVSSLAAAGDSDLAAELVDEMDDVGLEVEIAEDRKKHERLMSAFAALSDEGREIALEQIEALAKSPALRKEE